MASKDKKSKQAKKEADKAKERAKKDAKKAKERVKKLADKAKKDAKKAKDKAKEKAKEKAKSAAKVVKAATPVMPVAPPEETYASLRARAKDLRVPNYSRMSKVELQRRLAERGA